MEFLLCSIFFFGLTKSYNLSEFQKVVDVAFHAEAYKVHGVESGQGSSPCLVTVRSGSVSIGVEVVLSWGNVATGVK